MRMLSNSICGQCSQQLKNSTLQEPFLGPEPLPRRALAVAVGAFSQVGFTEGRVSDTFLSLSLPLRPSAMTETPLSTCLWGKDS